LLSKRILIAVKNIYLQYIIAMNTFEIRLALTRDAKHIATMSRDHIEQGLGWKYQQAQILDAIREPDTNVITAWHESTLTGFAIMNYQGFEAHLVLFAVLPAYRRQGTGTQLIQWLIKTAEVAGVQTVTVELRKANTIAHNFYESLGFKQLEPLRNYYRGVEHGERMALDLRRRE
jgi:[ribosomal protein S18]-alanine N-acetyltransferase